MAKRKLTEKEILEHLHAEGFKKVGAAEKKTAWYKKTLGKSECISKKASCSASR